MGLFTPIYMKGNLSVNQARKAIAMVKKMTDQAKLAEIAREGKDNSVRRSSARWPSPAASPAPRRSRGG